MPFNALLKLNDTLYGVYPNPLKELVEPVSRPDDLSADIPDVSGREPWQDLSDLAQESHDQVHIESQQDRQEAADFLFDAEAQNSEMDGAHHPVGPDRDTSPDVQRVDGDGDGSGADGDGDGDWEYDSASTCSNKLVGEVESDDGSGSESEDDRPIGGDEEGDSVRRPPDTLLLREVGTEELMNEPDSRVVPCISTSRGGTMIQIKTLGELQTSSDRLDRFQGSTASTKGEQCTTSRFSELFDTMPSVTLIDQNRLANKMTFWGNDEEHGAASLLDVDYSAQDDIDMRECWTGSSRSHKVVARLTLSYFTKEMKARVTEIIAVDAGSGDSPAQPHLGLFFLIRMESNQARPDPLPTSPKLSRRQQSGQCGSQISGPSQLSLRPGMLSTACRSLWISSKNYPEQWVMSKGCAG